MKVSALNSFKWVLSLSLAACLATAAHARETLTFSTLADHPLVPVATAILTQAYKKLDIAIKVIPLPAARAIYDANEGKYDGELGRVADMRKQYHHLFQVPTPYIYVEAVLYTKDPNLQTSKGLDLQRYRIGSYVGNRYFEKITRELNRVMVNKPQTLFSMLEHDRIDLIMIDQFFGQRLLAQMGTTHIHRLQGNLGEIPIYHYLHRKHLDILMSVDAVLQKMQASGELEKIRNQYLSMLHDQHSDSSNPTPQ